MYINNINPLLKDYNPVLMYTITGLSTGDMIALYHNQFNNINPISGIISL